jgi:hypothetical protein
LGHGGGYHGSVTRLAQDDAPLWQRQKSTVIDNHNVRGMPLIT